MVSRVEKIVFIIRDSFFELYGEKRKVWNRKRSVFRGVDYSTNFYGKPWKSMVFRCLTKKLTVNKCCKIVIIINF